MSEQMHLGRCINEVYVCKHFLCYSNTGTQTSAELRDALHKPGRETQSQISIVFMLKSNVTLQVFSGSPSSLLNNSKLALALLFFCCSSLDLTGHDCFPLFHFSLKIHLLHVLVTWLRAPCVLHWVYKIYLCTGQGSDIRSFILGGPMLIFCWLFFGEKSQLSQS